MASNARSAAAVHAAAVRNPTPLVVLSKTEFTGAPGISENVVFYMGLALVFIKFALLQEIQNLVMHFNAYLMYIFGIPAVLGVIATGGLRRAFSGRTACYWAGYTLWMVAVVPFSSWRGGSLNTALGFVRGSFIMFLVIAGLVVTWTQCRRMVGIIGFAAVINVLTSRIFGGERNDRLNLEFGGSVSNANDFAALLLLTLPFLLLLVFSSKSFLIRVGAFCLLGVGVLTVLLTGSRGALIALGVDVVFLFWRGSMRQRLALTCLVPLAMITTLILIPGAVLRRISSFSATEAGVSEEAIQSSQTRYYLLRKAVEYTIKFPITGVGPAQFSNFEGGNNRTVGGVRGVWQGTHNTWLQTSAECGIPAGLLFLAGWVSAFSLVNRIHARAKRRADCRDIQQMASCILLAIVGFCTAITFLNFAYYFYGPAIGGIAIAFSRTANNELNRRSEAAGV